MRRRIPSGDLDELRWWKDTLDHWDGRRLLVRPNKRFDLFTDASGGKNGALGKMGGGAMDDFWFERKERLWQTDYVLVVEEGEGP